MIEIIKKVVDAHEHGRFMKCGLDTLIRIDEYPDVFSCEHCVFQDIIIDDDVICPLKIIGELLLLK